uniref:Deacetylase sirtuin-type domain-containing protein n=1 Tax=Heterorhabditis bacteriophora TaxID=37862 RepID=A0A1I7X488_HETBA
MSLRFVPACKPLNSDALNKLIGILADIDKLLILTGAGLSTESGIPDYRSKKVGLYERSTHKPTTHQEFMNSEKARRRFWARNFLAWPSFSRAKCNPAHFAIASWERSDRFTWLITQNVDGLHQKEEYQNRLFDLNPNWMDKNSPGDIAPDGDVNIAEGADESFQLANCNKCGGIVKTDIIFFGDNVPTDVVNSCYAKVEESDGLLVLGSSLTVMSGYRFVYHASLRNKPIIIVNIGPTRADSLATVKISSRVSEVICKL